MNLDIKLFWSAFALSVFSLHQGCTTYKADIERATVLPPELWPDVEYEIPSEKYDDYNDSIYIDDEELNEELKK